MEKLLTPEKVADLFDLKVGHVKELARQGKIPAIKVGKLWRFPLGQLEDWVKNGKIGGDDKEVNDIVDGIIKEVS